MQLPRGFLSEETSGLIPNSPPASSPPPSPPAGFLRSYMASEMRAKLLASLPAILASGLPLRLVREPPWVSGFRVQGYKQNPWRSTANLAGLGRGRA